MNKYIVFIALLLCSLVRPPDMAGQIVDHSILNAVVYEGHECQWGPSWPYATSMTLTGLANLLNNQEQTFICSRNYVTLLSVYARSQYRQRVDGKKVISSPSLKKLSCEL